MLGIIAAHGLGLLPFALHASPVPSLIGFAASGVIYGPYSALSFSLLQERTPAAHLTTVLAARTAVLLTASPVGAASGGLLLGRAGPAPLVTGCGIAMIALAAIAALVLYTRFSSRHDRLLGLARRPTPIADLAADLQSLV